MALRISLSAFTATLLLVLGWPADALAESYRAIQERRPELFHPETGYRIDWQRAPTPDDIPEPAQRISPQKARALIAQDAVVLDVSGALQSRFDELDGTWLVAEPRMSLPGAVWLPEVGRGVLEPALQTYLEDQLDALSHGQTDRDILVFCVADCWMSWNAAQRITALGYSKVYWYRLGTDGWRDMGWDLEPVEPVPVNVDQGVRRR